ncbi:uncharacterized protein LOC143275534 [Babylonia areolata]|uniref:uncharacterized protein LOC143275534 n=1 Tax=Babylonia areolata TaxID=304850 RepID=UPI003FD38F6F
MPPPEAFPPCSAAPEDRRTGLEGADTVPPPKANGFTKVGMASVCVPVDVVWIATSTILDLTTEAYDSPALGNVASTNLRASKNDIFFSVFTFWISFSFFQVGQSLDEDGWLPPQFTQRAGLMHLPWCAAFEQVPHASSSRSGPARVRISDT